MKSKKIKFQSFFKDHIKKLNNSLLELNSKILEKASEKILTTIKNEKQIFVCGNGGSAAIANHYVPDYLKLIRQNTRFKPIVKSLSSDLELITAISNDFDYSKIFSYQAESLCKKGDLLIIISSSWEINEVYDEAMKSGALGGKLLGSGGGGFFIFYVPKNNQNKLRKKLNKFEEVDFRFSKEGSSIIFNNE